MENIIYITIILLLVAFSVFIVYKYSKIPKEKDEIKIKEKSTKETAFSDAYKALTEEKKHEVLDFKLKCAKFGLTASVSNIVAYVTKVNDLDKLFNILLICKTSEFDLSFDNLLKVNNEGFNIDEYVEVSIDLNNSGLAVPVSSYLIHLKKGNSGRKFADILIKSLKSGVDLVCNDIIKHSLKDDEAERILFSLIRAKKANIYLSEEERLKLNLSLSKDYMLSYRISKNILFELHKAGKNVDKIVNVMIRSHESDVELHLQALDIYTLKDDDFEALVNNLIKAKKAGVYIEQEDLLHQNISGNAIGKLVNATIIARKNDLNMEFSELMDYHLLTGGDVLNYINALVVIKKNSLDLNKDYLVSMTTSSNDLIDLVNSLKFIRDFPDAGFQRAEIEKHFKKKGKVLDLIKTVFNANAGGIKLSFGLASEIECSKELDLIKMLRMTVEPLMIEVEPPQMIITKEGIQVTPRVFVTWKARIDKIFSGFKEDVIFQRINESLIYEIENCKNHLEVLEKLTLISKRILKKIKGQLEIPENCSDKDKETILASNLKEAEIDDNSAYELLEISIFDLKIGKDIKTELKLEEEKTIAHIHELHAHANMIEAEVNLRQAMVEAYVSGEIPNFNELHKDTILREKKDNSGH